MSRGGVFILAGACFASSLGVVYATHQSRKLFVELQVLQAFRDHVEVEWGRMQLEQSTWATHGRIEAMARDRLGMMLPPQRATEIVRP